MGLLCLFVATRLRFKDQLLRPSFSDENQTGCGNFRCRARRIR